MITIGERKLATRRPADLDAQLVAVTGCSAAEIAAGLRRGAEASHVATALRPFLHGDALPAPAELAAAIAAADVYALRTEVLALYDAAEAAA